MRFYIVDVFTMTPFSGNPACVIMQEGRMDPATKSKIASEMNQPESVFVRSTKGGYDLSFFTRGREVEFCGHGTIAAIWVVARQAKRKEVRVSTPKGTFRGWTDERCCAFVEHPVPSFQAITGGKDTVARVLNLDMRDIDPELPLETADIGIRQLMVPVRSLDALKRVEPDEKKLRLLTAYAGLDSIHVFAQEAFDPDACTHARHFAPYYNIPEDAVTGTGNASAIVYLVRHGRIDMKKQRRMLCEQGHLIGRPGMVIVNVDGDAKKSVVRRLSFGGACSESITGEISRRPFH